MLRKTAGLLGAAAVLTLGATAPAGAETAPASGGKFAAQATAAGLDASQAAALQKRVGSRIAEEGGRQVSANRIALDGASILVVVPGETYARDLAGGQSEAQAKEWNCPEKYFCMWRGTNATGERKDLYYCRDYGLTNWTGNGSWSNNQVGNVQAAFKRQNGTVIHWSLPSPSHNTNYNWDPVWAVKPC
ncbi:peptidase inhibitor family I36 protein [Streptomyces sp. NBC_00237]|uniref:peptidase inhibitor family I36 protein n=1 Tax=Streptomyces sp. NBC_00237 TaxID=2975687 RepID=UPI002255802A|nr:peptidase inhibitor family I36 protein [Streptomyces sp. NBC_00237]MCX5205499.1 peptidase inhibitor family I36 protein [Streptomyces sp. NBC_00237]